MLLAGVAVPRLQGLEIGPLNNPAVRKGEGDISYIDHCSADELRVKYDGELDPASILDIDYVWGGQRLADAVIGRQFDYVVASHVIEHVPDMVGWLQEIEEVLKPTGQLCLAIPDRRYTFDYLRPLTTVGELIDAHLRRAKVPSPKQIYDNYTMACHIEAGAAWAGALDPRAIRRIHPPGLARNFVERVFTQGDYIDCHCWVFTPASFVECHAQLLQENLMPLAITRFQETLCNENEFFVGMRRT